MRITSAPPAIPASRAIHPQSRPMTSRTRMRWWLSAVVWSLSSASVAVLTALLNPKVTSVASRSLSIVFGTPTTFTPFSKSACVIFIVPSPPTVTRQSIPDLLDVPHDLARDVLENRHAVLVHRVVERVPPVRGAEDRSSARLDASHVVRVENSMGVGLEEAVESVLNAEHLPSVLQYRRPHDAAYDGVEPRAVAAPREYRDAFDLLRAGRRRALRFLLRLPLCIRH